MVLRVREGVLHLEKPFVAEGDTLAGSSLGWPFLSVLTWRPRVGRATSAQQALVWGSPLGSPILRSSSFTLASTVSRFSPSPTTSSLTSRFSRCLEPARAREPPPFAQLPGRTQDLTAHSWSRTHEPPRVLEEINEGLFGPRCLATLLMSHLKEDLGAGLAHRGVPDRVGQLDAGDDRADPSPSLSPCSGCRTIAT